ncbi:MAG: ATP-binding protein [Streptosporangiaceae bacterium]
MRRREGTLRGRLALLALVSSAAWVLLLTVLFNVLLSAHLRDQTDGVVRTRAEAAAATLTVHRDRTITITEPADDEALDTGVWIYQGGRVLERPSASRLHQRYADALAGAAGSGFTSDAGARWYTRPVRFHGERVGTIVAATSLDPYQAMTVSALTGSITLAVLLLAGGYLLTRAVVGRALRPVARMSRLAAEWSTDDLDRRFGAGRRPAELSALATQLDLLLDRISVVLRHEQRWSAELSHELRTPLSKIVAEADWLAGQPRDTADRDASLEAIRAAAGQMQQITDTLLAEARDRTSRLPGRCDLRELAAALSEHWEGTGPALRIGVEGEPVAGAATEIVERVLAPLLDNARRYAATTVTLTCENGVRITLHDDGPGVPDDAVGRLFEPGFRAYPDDGHAGAGLGLALARRLARSADGDVIYTDGRFVVELPPG